MKTIFEYAGVEICAIHQLGNSQANRLVVNRPLCEAFSRYYVDLSRLIVYVTDPVYVVKNTAL